MNDRPKVFFLIPSLQAGGAERVASLLMNHWALNDDFELVCCTFDVRQNDFYLLHKSIKRLVIAPLAAPKDIMGRIALIVKRLIVMRRSLRKIKPDIVISFLDRPGLLSILAAWGLKMPVIVSERTNPLFYNNGNFYDRLKRRIFPYAQAFVAQTSEVGTWAETFMQKEHVFVIPNPVGSEFKPRHTIAKEKIVISVGRLCMEKGFDMLLEAFSLIAPQYPDWTLQIVGGGEEEEKMRGLIVKYGITSQVELVGTSSHPHKYLEKASIYVTSSRVEGFPNALLEAMAMGLPPISFNFSCGPKDLISHQKNGLLVEKNDIQGLASAMAYLIENKGIREALGKEAAQAQDMYSLEKISSRWKDLIELLVPKRSKR